MNYSQRSNRGSNTKSLSLTTVTRAASRCEGWIRRLSSRGMITEGTSSNGSWPLAIQASPKPGDRVDQRSKPAIYGVLDRGDAARRTGQGRVSSRWWGGELLFPGHVAEVLDQ